MQDVFGVFGGDGFECYVHSKKNVPLGECFAKHVKAAGQNLRSSSVAPGVKINSGLYVLKHTKMLAILNEGAFVDNKKDIQDWDEDHVLKKLGIAYAEAAAEYLKLEKKSVTPAPEEPEDTIPDKEYIYRVQVGAYSGKSGAEKMLAELKSAGFGGIIVKSEK